MQDRTKHILMDALEETSSLLPEKINYSDDLVLWGTDGMFNSLELVNFISTVETLISDKFDKEVTIVSEKAFSKRNSPFKSMETFGNFIEELLEEIA
jgi:hypothetical protein